MRNDTLRYRVIALFIILLFSVTIIHPYTVYAAAKGVKLTRSDSWVKIDNGVITIVIPSYKGRIIPIYFWWYDKEPDKIYVAHYYGIAEVWLAPLIKFRHKHMFKEGFSYLEQIMHKFRADIAVLADIILKLHTAIEEAYTTASKTGDFKVLEEEVNKSLNALNKIHVEDKILNETIEDIKTILRDIIPLCKSHRELKIKLNITLNNISKIAYNISKVKDGLISDLRSHKLSIEKTVKDLNTTINEFIKGRDIYKDCRKLIEKLTTLLQFKTGNSTIDSLTSKTKSVLSKIKDDLDKAANSTGLEKAKRMKDLGDDLISLISSTSSLLAKYGDFIENIDVKTSKSVSILLSYSKTGKNALNVRKTLNATLSIYLNISYSNIDIQSKVDKLKQNLSKALSFVNEAEKYRQDLEEVKSKISGDVESFKRDIDKIISHVRKKSGRMMQHTHEIMHGVTKAVRLMHPFLLPFPTCTWRLDGPYNITDSKGNVIGVRFNFIIVRAPGKWSFIREGDIIIRNRIYTITVNETVGNETHIVTSTELKNDIIIKHWVWNYDILKKYLGNLTSILPTLESKLILISRITLTTKGVKFEDIEKALTSSSFNVKFSRKVSIHCGRSKVNASANISTEADINATSFKKSNIRTPRLLILAEGSKVAGFYRFIPYAYVKCGNATRRVNVSGVFWITGGTLRIFLVYPYFGNCSLEHDPSIGVDTGETVKAELATIVTPSGSVTMSTPTPTATATPTPTPISTASPTPSPSPSPTKTPTPTGRIATTTPTKPTTTTPTATTPTPSIIQPLISGGYQIWIIAIIVIIIIAVAVILRKH